MLITKEEAEKIEGTENIYIDLDSCQYNHGSYDAEEGWLPISQTWVDDAAESIITEFVASFEITQKNVELQDLNDSSNEFNASAVQVAVWIGSGVCFQTSDTYDAGSMSSQLAINGESGAYDSVKDLMTEHGFSDEFIGEYVYFVGSVIGGRAEVQKVYDEYMQEIGTWEREDNSMDANSEVFVKKTDEYWTF